MESKNINEQNHPDYQKRKALKALELAKQVEAQKTVKAVRLNHKTIIYKHVNHH